ncbi:MAG: hypothetical protein KGL39_51620 [Patescibacteria group bacterium]|nr:hypothetical protein [Patescibacteria group bacterium]
MPDTAAIVEPALGADATGAAANKKEIRIHWGGRVYGPYSSSQDALKDGFHIPSEETA